MTFAQFRQLIANVAHIPVERIGADSRFREDHGIDSLQLVNLVTRCIEPFGADLEVIADADALQQVGSFYRALAGKESA